MNETDKQKLVDEVVLLNKEKSNAIEILTSLKDSILIGNEINKILEDRRKKYNSSFITLYKNNNAVYDDLYNVLNKIWEDCLNEKSEDEVKNNAMELAKNSEESSSTGKTSGIIPLPYDPMEKFKEMLVVITEKAKNFIKLQMKINEIWNKYKVGALAYTESFIQK